MARARVIVVRDGAVAVIERRREDRRYYVFPGGGIEAGEAPAAAAMREAFEELGLTVAIQRLVARVTYPAQVASPAEAHAHYIFLAEAVGGTLGTGRGAEMAGRRPDRGTYKPMWLPIAGLPHRHVYPRSVAMLLATALREGWPTEPLWLVEQA